MIKLVCKICVMALAVGLTGCVVAPPYGYGYAPAPAYGYGYYGAPTVDVGIGYSNWGHGWRH